MYALERSLGDRLQVGLELFRDELGVLWIEVGEQAEILRLDQGPFWAALGWASEFGVNTREDAEKGERTQQEREPFFPHSAFTLREHMASGQPARFVFGEATRQRARLGSTTPSLWKGRALRIKGTRLG